MKAADPGARASSCAESGKLACQAGLSGDRARAQVSTKRSLHFLTDNRVLSATDNDLPNYFVI